MFLKHAETEHTWKMSIVRFSTALNLSGFGNSVAMSDFMSQKCKFKNSYNLNLHLPSQARASTC